MTDWLSRAVLAVAEAAAKTNANASHEISR